MAKMTDEDVTTLQRIASGEDESWDDRWRAWMKKAVDHLAALTAERDDYVKDAQTLRERVKALEASVTRLRDGLWARGFAAEYPSEAGSVVDCALATVAGAESRLAAIRQRAGDIEAMDDAHSGGGIVGVSRYILGADAPSPSESMCQHCGRTTNGRDAHLCTRAARVAPSEMSVLEGEMAEPDLSTLLIGRNDPVDGTQPPAPTTSEAFATAHAGVMSDAATDALSLLERRMGAQEAALRALILLVEQYGRGGVVSTGGMFVALDHARAALTDAPPVLTLEEVETLERVACDCWWREEARRDQTHRSVCGGGRVREYLTALRR